MHERKNRCGEGWPERLRLGRVDVSSFESSEGLSGKVVVAPRLHRGHSLAEASKRECMVPHGADVMFGLPDTPTLDAGARVERIDDAPPEKLVRNRRCGNLEVACSRLAEEKPESWPGRAKSSRDPSSAWDPATRCWRCRLSTNVQARPSLGSHPHLSGSPIGRRRSEMKRFAAVSLGTIAFACAGVQRRQPRTGRMGRGNRPFSVPS